MGEAAALEKDGVERDLQEQLAAAPQWCGEGFRLVRREWPTDIGPVDLMCRDAERRLDRGRDQAHRDDRRGRAAHPLPRAHPARPGDGRLPRRPRGAGRSSRRRACWPSRAASPASRSTSPSCAASASRTSRCSRRESAAGHEHRTARRPHRAARQRPGHHAEPPRGAQRRQPAARGGRSPRGSTSSTPTTACSVGVLTGAGGYFCAGMDLKAFVTGERPWVGDRGFAGIVAARVAQAADRGGRGLRASPAGSRSRWRAT